jgi:hypothetical protein
MGIFFLLIFKLFIIIKIFIYESNALMKYFDDLQIITYINYYLGS